MHKAVLLHLERCETYITKYKAIEKLRFLFSYKIENEPIQWGKNKINSMRMYFKRKKKWGGSSKPDKEHWKYCFQK